jgi:hypothetical protein
MVCKFSSAQFGFMGTTLHHKANFRKHEHLAAKFSVFSLHFSVQTPLLKEN